MVQLRVDREEEGDTEGVSTTHGLLCCHSDEELGRDRESPADVPVTPEHLVYDSVGEGRDRGCVRSIATSSSCGSMRQHQTREEEDAKRDLSERFEKAMWFPDDGIEPILQDNDERFCLLPVK